jgi:hypothetical protein
VRVLADPFRLKLLGAFGRRPRTTKQVAQELGEKPTKLYHHVEALKRVGLLALKETRPNRGTMEKYYQAVATRFQIGGALFATGETAAPLANESGAVLMSILDTTRAELAAVLNQSAGELEHCPASSAVVARMLLRGKAERIQQFRARLLDLLDQFKAETVGVEPGKSDAYGLTLAFYPVPSPTPGGKSSGPRVATAGRPNVGRRASAKRRSSGAGRKLPGGK